VSDKKVSKGLPTHTAFETICAADHGMGCLGKAAPDEPVFVLRAQDKFAPVLVRLWASLVLNETSAGGNTDKAQQAEMIAHEMSIWQMENKKKLPD
jgi:hypothetical protein